VTAHRVAAYAVAGALAAWWGAVHWYNGLVTPGSVGTGWLINISSSRARCMRHPVGAFLGAIVFVLLQNFAIDVIDRERFNLVIVSCSSQSSCSRATACSAGGRPLALGFQPTEEGLNGKPQADVLTRASRSSGPRRLGGAAFAQSAPRKDRPARDARGPVRAGGQDGIRGAELAVRQRNGMVAGRKIEIIKLVDAKPTWR